MNLQATCPNCGKQFVYESESAGQPWLCSACGKMMRLPLPLPPPTPQPVVSNPIAAEAQMVIEPGMNPLMPWMIVLGSAVFILGMALLWVILSGRDQTWEQQHGQEVRDIKAQAETLADRGNYAEAYSRFRDLQFLVSGNPVNDPTLKEAIQTAEKEQDQAMFKLMRETVAPRDMAKTNTPPASQPVSLTQSPATPPAAAEMAPAVPVAVALHRPAVHPVPVPSPAVDDDRIGQAINGGVQFLLNRFAQNKVKVMSDYSPDGVDALCIYALLQAYHTTGDSRLDPRRNFMKQALDTLRTLPMNDTQGTYSRSLRANALALANRPEDLPTLKADLQWLLVTGPTGAYTYPSRDVQQTAALTGFIWDNSNSQYGLLGVWAAAEAGLPVPHAYWLAAQHHWTTTQLPTGEWSYGVADPDAARRSMTFAGVASLMVTQDYLHTANGEEAQPAQLTRAINWLESGDNGVATFREGALPGYTAFGLERVGLATGFKYFGKHDWYRECAADVVAAARPDGGWDDAVATSFAMLFLARGRHPVMMNKLRFDGDWNDRPRDVANLARYAGHELERPLNWQVVPIDHDWQDWSDCPILYISGKKAPDLKPEDEEKLRQYVLNGGLILTVAENNGAAFGKWATDLGTRLFTGYSWQTPPADHPLWKVLLKLKNPPKFEAINNGSRLLMVNVDEDVARWWQDRGEKDHPEDFAFGLDLFLYATGRSDLHNRLVTRAIPAVDEPPAASISMVELQVGPDSDPESAAWPRFANYFRRQTDLGLNLKTGPLEGLTPENSPLAHLTGVNAFKATDGQCMALHDYVNAGGVVLIDPCGGPNEFLKSVKEDLLPRAFANIELTRLEKDHPLFNSRGDGMAQLWPLEVRDYVRGLETPVDRGVWILRSGKGAVVVSSMDITSGLLGTNTWGVAGFTPEYSLALAKNFVLWAWDGAKE